MSDSIRDVETAVRELGALPMPAGPQLPPFPPAPQDFEEKLRQDVARLQELLADAVRKAHRACSERDLMRERVSEPFGCKHCGEAKRSHGRRYVLSAGVHAWVAPSDEQVKDRMLARRVARMALPSNLSLWEEGPEVERLRARVAELEAQRDRRRARLVELQNDALNMRGALSPNGERRKVPMSLGDTLAPAVEWLINRVAELEAERHSTNEALSGAAERMRADRDRIARLEAAAVEGRGALAAFCHDLEDPGSNAFGALYLLSQATAGVAAQPDDAAKALARHDGKVLRQAAAELMAACPEHGDADEAWMDCPCEYAEELERMAVLTESGAAS